MLFLGAGASAHFGIPTSSIFTEKIETVLEEQHPELLREFKKHHKDIYSEEPNFEHILTLLKAATNPDQIPLENYCHSFLTINPEFKKDYSSIIDDMLDVVCELCCSPFEQNSNNYLDLYELEKKFSLGYDLLFGGLIMDRTNVHVFTPNYDPSIEIWCQKRNIPLFDGTERTENPEIKTVKLIESQLKEFKNQVKGLFLLRMHGSIWQREISLNKQIKFTSPQSLLYYKDMYSNILNKKPNLIFPGEESNVLRGNWYQYFNFFKENLHGKCLFVGYSFSHSAITNSVIDALRDDKITLLGIWSHNPNEIIKRINPDDKIPQHKFLPIRGDFGKKEGILSIRKWFDTFGNIPKYSNDDSLIGRIYPWIKLNNNYLE